MCLAQGNGIFGDHRLPGACVRGNKHRLTVFHAKDGLLLEGVQFEGVLKKSCMFEIIYKKKI